jgi:hypothetical protein
VRESLPDERIKFVPRTTGRKVSDMLMEFAGPWLDEARNDVQRKTVVGMAVLAWNMAGIPEPERWDGVSPEFAGKLAKPAKAILQEMIERKLLLYPKEDHSILDYEITGGGAGMRVEVAFTLSSAEMADLRRRDQAAQGC